MCLFDQSHIRVQLAALKPPFVADSFPALKRVVTAGRYQPISRKYSEALHRVIGQMLRVNPRERPSAEALLNSADFAPKLQLDEIAMSMAKQRSRENEHMKLMETIKVPQNLKKIDLPKPCYPDVRPNSPSSWPMADQVQHSNKAQGGARPPRPPPILETHFEENMVPETNRSDRTDVPNVKPRLVAGAGPSRNPSMARLDGGAPGRGGASEAPPPSRAAPPNMGGPPPSAFNRGGMRPGPPLSAISAAPQPSQRPGVPTGGGRPQYQHRMW